MNLSLLASRVKRFSRDENKRWKKIIEHKYRVDNHNIFLVLPLVSPPFGRVSYGMLKLLKWGISGKMEMARKLSFQKTIGLGYVVWLSSSG
jgi:hypothetical protein